MKLFGETALRGFVKKYFGDPKNIKGVGDGTVTGAIKTVSDKVNVNAEDITRINKDLSDVETCVSELNTSLEDTSELATKTSNRLTLVSRGTSKGFINTCEVSNESQVGFKYKVYQNDSVPIIQIDNSNMPLIRDRVAEYPLVGIHAGIEGTQWFLYVSFYATGAVHTRKIQMN